jgi:hypothetical protein
MIFFVDLTQFSRFVLTHPNKGFKQTRISIKMLIVAKYYNQESDNVSKVVKQRMQEFYTNPNQTFS